LTIEETRGKPDEQTGVGTIKLIRREHAIFRKDKGIKDIPSIPHVSEQPDGAPAIDDVKERNSHRQNVSATCLEIEQVDCTRSDEGNQNLFGVIDVDDNKDTIALEELGSSKVDKLVIAYRGYLFALSDVTLSLVNGRLRKSQHGKSFRFEARNVELELSN
jgi:hypothetical protein